MTGTSLIPVAILGYGCRFPGGVSNGPDFWDLLRSGRDAVVEVPPDRWSAEAYYSARQGIAGKSLSRWGGFLDRIDEFEPECFGMSPREAAFVDPQQRLLLETTWEALEHAGLSISSLAGSRTGVFVGISNVDYGHVQSLPTHQRGLGPFTATGSSSSIAANRISYCLDLRGPSMSMDTACSSALVALDIAVKHLCAGQADLAIAGGANIILAPETFIMFSSAFMLSPDGRCKAFDASANGFVRAEGAGVVVLKRLEDALRDHDPIQAVIVASGTNQDGRTGGISLPNVDAQEQLLRDVYSEARIALESVGYVEAHGTGTSVGDPVEAEALGRVFAASHSDGCPLYIGSVKTNIGHLESGSGIAAVIKAILMLQYRQIPPSLHFHTPNPAIDFERLRLSVPTAVQAWPNEHPATIGVNSFGFGGANAHVVLGEFCPGLQTYGSRQRQDRPEATDAKQGSHYPMLLTARSPEALTTLAQSWTRFLAEGAVTDTDLADMAYSTFLRRSHYRHRVGFAATGIAEAQAAIQAYLAGESHPGAYSAEAPHRPPHVAFVFCGQGAHWYGMGKGLLKEEPVFR
ncbi:MAG: beta-ketoacyl synthase N-terminal-like domain-containing protein, partial [Candidatus Hydrogenedentales bacterium]